MAIYEVNSLLFMYYLLISRKIWVARCTFLVISKALDFDFGKVKPWKMQKLAKSKFQSTKLVENGDLWDLTSIRFISRRIWMAEKILKFPQGHKRRVHFDEKIEPNIKLEKKFEPGIKIEENFEINGNQFDEKIEVKTENLGELIVPDIEGLLWFTNKFKTKLCTV